MRSLWLRLRYGPLCPCVSPHGVNPCVRRVRAHPSFNGQQEHFDGRMWWM